MEAMRFRGALQRILGQILTSDLRLGPVYLRKVDLADVYMRLWVRMEDVQSVSFLVPKKNTSDLQLVGFQLSLPMGYVDSAPYFFMAIETVFNLSNKSIAQWDGASAHPMDQEYESRAADDTGTPEAQSYSRWEHLPAKQCSSATDNVYVYLDDFISVVQGGPREGRKILRHLFHQTDRIFHPNTAADTKCKTPHLPEEAGARIWGLVHPKTVLGWDFDTIAHLLCLPPRRQEKVEAALAATPKTVHNTSL